MRSALRDAVRNAVRALRDALRYAQRDALRGAMREAVRGFACSHAGEGAEGRKVREATKVIRNPILRRKTNDPPIICSKTR